MTYTIDHLSFEVDMGTLSVLVGGPADGECMVLLHGIPANAELFREVMRALIDAGYRVFAPNMPGYGETRLADDADYALSSVADLYAGWLEKTIGKRVWLVGHDLGGAVAQLMAVRYPQLISHLSMGDTVAGDTFPVFGVKLMIVLAKLRLFPLIAAWKLMPNPYVNWQLQRAFGDGFRLAVEVKRRVFWDGKLKTAVGRHEFAKHLRHLRSDENEAILPQLKDIGVPTLLVWGEQDRYQPAQTVGKRLRRFLPDETAFEIIQGAGHFLPLENPLAYVKTLLNWRAGVDGERK